MSEREKRDIYEDVKFYLAKKEEEDEKQLHANNRDYMLDVFSNISSITYRTLWSEVRSVYVSCLHSGGHFKAEEAFVIEQSSLLFHYDQSCCSHNSYFLLLIISTVHYTFNV